MCRKSTLGYSAIGLAQLLLPYFFSLQSLFDSFAQKFRDFFNFILFRPERELGGDLRAYFMANAFDFYSNL